MKNFEQYSDSDSSLYEVAQWAMLGLVDLVSNGVELKLYSFLDGLFETNEINGEPGWFIEIIDLNNGFEFMDIKDPLVLDKILHLKEVGESTCFWVNNSLEIPEDEIYTVDGFWSVIKDAINDFVETHPERYQEYVELKTKYAFIFQ